MTVRLVEIHYDGLAFWCDGCRMQLYTHRRFDSGFNSITLESYCVDCIRGMDVVYDYHLECEYFGCRHVFHDFETVRQHHPSLAPRLEKI